MKEPCVLVSNLGKIYHTKKWNIPRLFNLIKFNNKDSSFASYKALHDINFSVRLGHALGIIGKNGAGKSTLLQILSGVLQPSYGTFEIEGRVASLLELGSGFNPDFTGRENIFLYASMYGISHREIKSRIQSIIEFAEIKEFIDSPLRIYSSGMQMRLAFSIVTQIEAQILLIDESFAVGDSFFVQKCFRFIKEFKKKGILVLVSHDHHSILQFCDSCMWLEQGKMVSKGEPKVVIDQYLSSILVSVGKNNIDVIENKEKNEDEDGFGSFKARILNYKLFVNENESNSIQSNDNICLEINFKLRDKLKNIVVGFIIRNKFGLDIFSDKIINTSVNSLDSGSSYVASFEFNMPELKAGDYFVCVALAEKFNKKNQILHWINDSMKFKMHTDETVDGIFKNRGVKSFIKNVHE